MNSLQQSVGALYRMLNVCIMLYQCKIPNAGRAHNYPKMILSYILIVEHWRQNKHYTLKMMDLGMHCVNEELGELTFSVLARCVLGDYIKSDIEHMHKMYELLPIYIALKDDILKDVNNKDSIAWRYTIDTDSDEVRSTSFFFKRAIRQINEDKYQTYDGSSQCFVNSVFANECMLKTSLPIVYMSDTTEFCLSTFTQLKRELVGTFLSTHHDIWPIPNQNDDSDTDSEIDSPSQNIDDDDDVTTWGPEWELCKVGGYAVMRTEFERENSSRVEKGVELYKIIEKISDTTNVNDPDELAFSGLEYICTIPNTSENCVTNGQWNYIRGMSKESKVFNYTVIIYFDQLTVQQRIPDVVLRSMDASLSLANMFGLVN